MTVHKRKQIHKKHVCLKLSNNATTSPLTRRSSIKEIMGRIEVATKESPIAVFRKVSIISPNNLVAVFGDTVTTRKLITKKSFIGMFNSTMSTKRTYEQLVIANRGRN